MKTIQIGILGAGVVGRGVIESLENQRELLQERTGLDFRVKAVFDRSWRKKEEALRGIPASEDPSLVLEDPEIEIVVELLGGEEPAGSLILQALERGKSVVTANKALLARRGAEIFQKATERGLHLGFEAAVGAALPLIKNLRRTLVVNEISAFYGILNGTCNFIITRMQEGMEYEEALALAQKLGFAEADPSFDVNGNDAAQKLALLASLAFDTFVPEKEIVVEGISSLRKLDLSLTEEMGWVIRLLAVARREEGGRALLRVHPVCIPSGHILAHVNDEKNAVFFETSHSGPTLIMGQGAGALPTAAAVISDLVSIGRSNEKPEQWFSRRPAPQPVESYSYRFYLRFQTVDQPGVLSEISRILADHSISIASVHQQEGPEPVQVLVVTHLAQENAFREALKKIDTLPIILAPTTYLRILDDL